MSSKAVVREGPPEVVRAEAAALVALGPLELPGLVRPGPRGGTELVAGRSLAGEAPMPWPVAQAVLAPVADALAGIHAAGWVHGDVAPANVVVANGDGRGVLVDLGCAAPIGEAGSTGTPGFVAPEVVEGAPVSPAAEVWSLAAVALAAVGQPTPPGATLALRRALADDPADRPTAAELAAVLHLGEASDHRVIDPRAAITRDFGPRPPVPSAPPPAPAPRAGPLVAVVVVALGLGGAGRWWAAPASTATTARPVPVCAPVEGGARLAGDPDGDGCDVAATWTAGVLELALEPGGSPVRIAVGAPGDVVALGDWDCDGIDTPAAYRPSTGTLTTWDRWPVPGAEVAPTSTVAERRGGTLVVDHDDRSGCDRAQVGTPG